VLSYGWRVKFTYQFCKTTIPLLVTLVRRSAQSHSYTQVVDAVTQFVAFPLPSWLKASKALLLTVRLVT
jgi:hypothetical protein